MNSLDEESECSGCKGDCCGCSLNKRRTTPNPDNAKWIEVWCKT